MNFKLDEQIRIPKGGRIRERKSDAKKLRLLEYLYYNSRYAGGIDTGNIRKYCTRISGRYDDMIKSLEELVDIKLVEVIYDEQPEIPRRSYRITEDGVFVMKKITELRESNHPILRLDGFSKMKFSP